MTRVRAHGLALVNWRGVFYTCYELDDRVTALEGENGAGKTTVMIAAYTALLPDMNLLRFTNVGESGATGGDKGIHGRLGEPGRPSYVVLDLRIPGNKRVLAGVHLERRGSASVEPTRFVVPEFPPDVPLHDVLLKRVGNDDAVPELQELKQLIALAGARVQTLTARDYFEALHESRITPLRLTSGAERSKFNQLLRTSMVGGISRALASGLRGFMLEPETGLADTLKRMRNNLDACRRTRSEVMRATQLEHEIRGVYEAGQDMFAAAVHATRERASEHASALEAARESLDAAQERLARLDDEYATCADERARTRAELTRVYDQLGEATRRVQRTREANQIDRRIRALERDHQARQDERDDRQSDRDRARGAADRAREDRDERAEDRDAAARGLADVRAGFAELERRAAAYRLVTERVERARAAMPDRTVDPAGVAELHREVASQIGALDADAIRMDRAVQTHAIRRREFARVHAATERLIGEPVAIADAYERVLTGLAELRRLDDLAAEIEALPDRIAHAQARAAEQAELRVYAARLARDDRPLSSSRDVVSAFQAAERELGAAGETLRDEQSRRADAARARHAAEARIDDLTDACARWDDLWRQVQVLAQRWNHAITDSASLNAIRAALTGRRRDLRTTHASATGDLDRVRHAIEQLEHTGGQFGDSLLAARDAVEGELLAERFEYLSIDDAGPVQALLGPLYEAIAVEDIERATRVLNAATARPDTVWLISGDAALPVDERGRPPGSVRGSDAIVDLGGMRRVTRIPDHPVLGRRARARRLVELRARERSLAAEVEPLASDLRALDRDIAAITDLLPRSAILDQPDPHASLTQARDDRARADEAHAAHDAAATYAEQRVATAREHRDAVAKLLSRATLLDEPDLAHIAAGLRDRLSQARQARAAVDRVRDDRALVDTHRDVLREAPPTDEQLAVIRADKQRVEEKRDRLADLRECLAYVDRHREALAWADAEAELRAQGPLEPALIQQLDQAKAALKRAETALRQAEQSLDEATEALAWVTGELSSVTDALVRERKNLHDLEIADASDDAVAAACAQESAISARRDALAQDERKLSEQLTRCDERRNQARTEGERCRGQVDDAHKAWTAARERWERLEADAAGAGVASSVLTESWIERFRGRGNVNIWPEARSAQTLLIERLERAAEGVDLARQVRDQIRQDTESPQGQAYLRAWLLVREWLRRRVPPRIAEVDDPLEALTRLGDHLAGLDRRLNDQERALRGQSSDVARNISVHIRKARRQVTRLNHDLGQAHFGSIRAIRIRLDTDDNMQRVLDALRGQEGQRLLFQSDMPIEEAMAELFRRHGKTRRTGGERLLDYREYLRLNVEIQRKGSDAWEVADSNKVSTGEAIGVGASVMMVVLTAWEEQSNLLRTSKPRGAMRLLFLDEANRLSKASLAILFELCGNLDLQLIIAAPEVEHAQGCTTYHLERQNDERGREHVEVTGRRLVRVPQA